MPHIAQDSLATIYFEFTWRSVHAIHVERYLADRVSFTRDILPLGVKSRMRGLGVGDSVELPMDMAEVPPFKPGKVLDMPRARFHGPEDGDSDLRPRIGRFYPKNFIDAVPGTRPDSATPFRVVETDKAGFKADLNHPMAGREVTIRATVMDIHSPDTEPGKLCRWPDIILKGPGMQARLPDTPTDFLGDEPFSRRDESADADFYEQLAAESLLDSDISERVRRVYDELLKDGMDILDLMAGSASHLPDGIRPGSVTGLGLHARAMDANNALSARLIRNINDDPVLPFDDERFDAVICTAGIEYLTRPFAVFEEAARVLRPGGVFCVAFTDTWHEEKVISIWTELYDFERMGLVSQYFIRTELYNGMKTSSERGWPGRTENGSVFAVSGFKE